MLDKGSYYVFSQVALTATNQVLRDIVYVLLLLAIIQIARLGWEIYADTQIFGNDIENGQTEEYNKQVDKDKEEDGIYLD